jgi:hypothetical protein
MSNLYHRQVNNNDIKHPMTLLLNPDSTLKQDVERNSLMRTLIIPTSHINLEI